MRLLIVILTVVFYTGCESETTVEKVNNDTGTKEIKIDTVKRIKTH